MDIRNVSDFRRAMRNGKYAWPGGYPLYFITADGAALSYEAVQECKREILEAIAHNNALGGWRVIGVDVNWEDASLHCSHTGKRIESAYAEDDVDA